MFVYQYAMIALLLTGGTQSVSSQGFLDKLGKAIEKGGKALDDILTLGNDLCYGEQMITFTRVSRR